MYLSIYRYLTEEELMTYEEAINSSDFISSTFEEVNASDDERHLDTKKFNQACDYRETIRNITSKSFKWRTNILKLFSSDHHKIIINDDKIKQVLQLDNWILVRDLEQLTFITKSYEDKIKIILQSRDVELYEVNGYDFKDLCMEYLPIIKDINVNYRIVKNSYDFVKKESLLIFESEDDLVRYKLAI